MTRSRTDPPPGPLREFTMASPDGVLTVHVAVRPQGVAVERTVTRAEGRRLTQSVRFDDESAFVRWCHSDDLWFTYPLLFSQVTRRGCDFFNPGG